MEVLTEMYKSINRYERDSRTPTPLEMCDFSTALLMATDKNKLLDVLSYGTSDMKRSAFKRLAETGDPYNLSLAVDRMGRVPPVWLSCCYNKYSPDVVSNAVMLNALSVTDDVELTYYATGSTKVFSAVERPSFASWVKMASKGAVLQLPPSYKTIDDAAVTIAQREPLRDTDVDAVHVVLNHEPEALVNYDVKDVLLLLGMEATASELKQVAMALRSPVDSMIELHASLYGQGENVVESIDWIASNAPWLVLTSTTELQDELMLRYKPFMYVISRYKKDVRARQLVTRIRERVDPTRAALLLHYLGEAASGQVSEDVCPV